MRKLRSILTAAIVAVLMAGCSSDESGDEPTEIEPLQMSAVTKEDIIGVWRNGDYWVSFSEDGFMSAYLSDKCIAEGDYVIDKDTIKAESSMLYFCTKFLINKVDSTALDCTINYYELGLYAYNISGQEQTNRFFFHRTDELPCPKNNELIGKKFQYDMDVVVPYFGAERDTLPGKAYCNVGTHFLILRYIKVEDRSVEGGVQDYYVYRPPYIYYNEWYVSSFNASKDIINIRKISIENDSIIMSKP